MEKEVARWLHQQLGYNAAADSTLSASCRGNLKGLWEFLMANYKTLENQRHIHNVLAKHRREQESARRAPERQQQALQQRQHLAQLEAKAATLERTLASLQAAVEISTQDAAEQSGEQGLFKQELHETQTQTILLQAAMERVRRLMPLLQAKLSKLQADAELAKARCQASAGSTRRLQHVLHQLHQLSCSIRSELTEVLEGKIQQKQQQQRQQHSTLTLAAAPEQLDSARGSDQSISAGVLSSSGNSPHKKAAGSTLQDANGAMVPLGGGGSSTGSSSWEDARSPAAAAASGLQALARCSLVSGYAPSQGVQGSVLQLLQEAPELLLSCSSQLAVQASQELSAILDEAETALLAPLGWGSDGGATAGGQEPSSALKLHQQQQGLLMVAADVQAAAASCPYTLPWTIPWQCNIGLGQQQQHVPATFQSPEMLVKQRQQMHVQLYVQAKAAEAAAAAADEQLTQLLGSVPLLNGAAAGSWESQLAGLWLRAEGLRAEVAVLEQRKAEFDQDVDACLQAEANLQEKWVLITAAVKEDQELNHLLWQVATDNMELYAGLHSQREQARNLLQEQLVPCGAAAARSADAGSDELAQEAAVVLRLPLCGALAPQRLGAAPGAASTSLATVARLQLAAQRLSHLGRPTTAPKAFTAAHPGGPAAPAAGSGRQSGAVPDSAGSSSGSGVDAAAVSVLRAACAMDAMAPMKCPAALLMEVAGECQQLQQLQQQLDRLSALCRGASASAAQAAEHAEQLQEQVEDLRCRDRQQVLPWLADLLEAGQEQRVTKLQEVSSDIRHFWEMPAQHLLPDTKYEGKNCSGWLMEIQALHGRKRELSSQRP